MGMLRLSCSAMPMPEVVPFETRLLGQGESAGPVVPIGLPSRNSASFARGKSQVTAK